MPYSDTVDLPHLLHNECDACDAHNTNNSSCAIVEAIGSCAMPYCGSCLVPGLFSYPTSCPVGVHPSREDLVMPANDNTTLVTFKHNDSTGEFDLSSIDFIGNQDNGNDWYRVFKLISQNTTVQYSFTNNKTSTWYTLSSSDTFELVDYYTSLKRCGWTGESLGFNPLVEGTFNLYFRVNGNDPFISMSYTFTMNEPSMNSTVVIEDATALESTPAIAKNLDVSVPLVTKLINNAHINSTQQGLLLKKVHGRFLKIMMTPHGHLLKTLPVKIITLILNATLD